MATTHYRFLFALSVLLLALSVPTARAATQRYAKTYSKAQQDIVKKRGYPDAFIISYIGNQWSADRNELWYYYSAGIRIDFTNGKQTNTATASPDVKPYTPTPYRPNQFYLPLTQTQIEKGLKLRAVHASTISRRQTDIIWPNGLKTSMDKGITFAVRTSLIKKQSSKKPVPSGEKTTTTVPQGPEDNTSSTPAPLSLPSMHPSDDIVNSQGDALVRWSFDSITASVVNDASGHGNAGTIHDAQPATGHSGQALSFNGTTSFVSSSLMLDESSSSRGVTMSAWVYPTSVSTGRHHVISTDNGGYDWSLLREGGEWFVFTGEASRDTGFGVDLNTWQQLTAIFDPATKTIRVSKNGQQHTIAYLGFNTNHTTVTVGTNPSFDEHFAGLIDEVVVYGSALNSVGNNATTPIADLPTHALSPTPSSLPPMTTGHLKWSFDAVTGTTVDDETGQGNNGTIHDATVVSGYTGSGLNLNGTSSFVNTNLKLDESSASGGASMSLWVYPVGTQGGTLISTDSGGWGWSIYTQDGHWFVALGGAGKDTGFSFDHDVWQHLIAVFDPASHSVHFYKNAEKRDIPSLGFVNVTNPLTLGKNPGFGYNFKGIVDTVEVYGYARTPESSELVSPAPVATEPPVRHSDDIAVGPNDPIIKWSFENITGSNVIDDGPAGTMGTLVNATVVGGHTGNGVSLNGTNSSITTTFHLNQSTSTRGATFDLWVYPRSSKRDGTLLSTDNGGYDWSLYISNSHWFVFTGDDGKDTGIPVDFDTWQHVVVIFDPAAKTVTVSKNGATATIPSLGFDTSTNPVTIGTNPGFPGYNFDGIVDDVMIYPFAQHP